MHRTGLNAGLSPGKVQLSARFPPRCYRNPCGTRTSRPRSTTTPTWTTRLKGPSWVTSVTISVTPATSRSKQRPTMLTQRLMRTRLIRLQRIEHQPAEQLGIEVRRFRRHLLQVAGDLFDMLHRGGRDQHRQLALSGDHGIGDLAQQMHIAAL